MIENKEEKNRLSVQEMQNRVSQAIPAYLALAAELQEKGLELHNLRVEYYGRDELRAELIMSTKHIFRIDHDVLGDPRLKMYGLKPSHFKTTKRSSHGSNGELTIADHVESSKDVSYICIDSVKDMYGVHLEGSLPSLNEEPLLDAKITIDINRESSEDKNSRFYSLDMTNLARFFYNTEFE